MPDPGTRCGTGQDDSLDIDIRIEPITADADVGHDFDTAGNKVTET